MTTWHMHAITHFTDLTTPPAFASTSFSWLVLDTLASGTIANVTVSTAQPVAYSITPTNPSTFPQDTFQVTGGMFTIANATAFANITFPVHGVITATDDRPLCVLGMHAFSLSGCTTSVPFTLDRARVVIPCPEQYFGASLANTTAYWDTPTVQLASGATLPLVAVPPMTNTTVFSVGTTTVSYSLPLSDTSQLSSTRAVCSVQVSDSLSRSNKASSRYDFAGNGRVWTGAGGHIHRACVRSHQLERRHDQRLHAASIIPPRCCTYLIAC